MHFDLPSMSDVARRTVTGALVLGAAALVAAVSFGYVLVGVGACIGLGLGTLNFRLAGTSVARVQASGTEHTTRALGANTLGRLGLLTAIAFGLAFVNRGLGFGVIGGLAAFQVLLIFNVARSMAKAGPLPFDDAINASVVDDNPPPASPGSPAALEGGDDTTGGA